MKSSWPLLMSAVLLPIMACDKAPLADRSAADFAVGEHAMDRFGAKVAPAGDLNHDGFADVAVWAENFEKSRGKIYVYFGSKNGPSSRADFSKAGEGASDQYGHSFGGMGDVNHDGFGDFLVAAQNYSLSNSARAGKAYLHFGSSQGLRQSADWSLLGDANDLFGDCSGPAGDVNRDGYADVVIGAYGFDQGRGRAHVFHGGPQGLGAKPSWTAYGERAGDWYAYSVALAGDVNGDGYPDLLIGAKNAGQGDQSSRGKAYLYHGGPHGFSKGPSWSAQGETRDSLFGWRAVPAGDLNGDGYADIAISAYKHDGPKGESQGKAFVFYGSAQGLSQKPSWTRDGDHAAAFFSMGLAGADFDLDGYSDLLLGCPACRPKARLSLFRGGPQGLSKNPAWIYQGDNDGGALGTYVAVAGDVNGDGYPDVLAGAPSHTQSDKKWTGKAYLFYGGPGPGLRLRPR